MGSCAAPSAKGDDKFITTDYLQQCPLVEGGLSALSVPLCLKAHFCQAEIYNLRGHVSKNGKADSILTKRRGPA
ncbi:hypothetical protein LN027_29490, partial [Klebsiella pneumoniae]|nr:hypothetical protein [Klebsiella pneumoniae]MCJ7403910.1 hypothetical protein [Klebsiella pneumoniae]